jgi:hypothetical protein
MATHLMDSLVKELTNKLGDHPFYTLRQLTSINFFGSMPAARKALQEGRLPFFKISPRRLVVTRQSLIEYLEKNCVQRTCEGTHDSKREYK